MRVLPMSLISAVVVLAASWPALCDDVPELNVDPVCRGIAQQAKDPGERGGPDLAYSACVKSEQAMRQKLSKEWGTFAPAEKSHCIRLRDGRLRELHRSHHLPGNGTGREKNEQLIRARARVPPSAGRKPRGRGNVRHCKSRRR
jgi:hypothetical protein